MKVATGSGLDPDWQPDNKGKSNRTKIGACLYRMAAPFARSRNYYVYDIITRRLTVSNFSCLPSAGRVNKSSVDNRYPVELAGKRRRRRPRVNQQSSASGTVKCLLNPMLHPKFSRYA